jgi:Protein of unknown function (DUF3365)
MSRTYLVWPAIALVSIGTVAGQSSPAAFPSWAIREAPPEWQMVISRADLIIVSTHDALLRELREDLARGGPRAALASCHLAATGVSWRVGRGEGIATGRTSDRLRNPTNAPRPWAAALVTANAGRRARDVDGFAVDLGSKIGVLRPIVVQPMCLGCHGPADQISPDVRQILADRYPQDRATGFTNGEIRGWYWVEMPKPH